MTPVTTKPGRDEQQHTSISYFHHTSPLAGEGNGNPLQYSCLENSMDKGTWAPLGKGLHRGKLSPWGRKESDTTEQLNTVHWM